MQVTLAHIGAPMRKQDPYEGLVSDYLKRCVGVARCDSQSFRTEAAFFDWLGKQKGRTEPVVLLLDGRGRQMTSEALADWLGARRDEGVQHVFRHRARGWMVREARAEGKRRGGCSPLGR